MNATEAHVAKVEQLSELLAIAPEQVGPAPTDIAEISVGDLVAIYSRGTTRVARVTKVGRTNVAAEYVTRGGLDEAMRRTAGSTVEMLLEGAARSDEYAARYEAEAGDAADDEWIENGSYSRITAKGLRLNAASSRESAQRSRERAAFLAENRGRYYATSVSVTTKSTKLGDIVGHRPTTPVAVEAPAAPIVDAGPVDMTFEKVTAGWYATLDGRYAVVLDGWARGQHDDGEITGGEWGAVYDREGRLREDHNAGENLDWYSTKRDAVAFLNRHAREGQLRAAREALAEAGVGTPEAPAMSAVEAWATVGGGNPHTLAIAAAEAEREARAANDGTVEGGPFLVSTGVHGASRVNENQYPTLDEAKAKALRWSQSNSTGHYWAQVRDAEGMLVAQYN